MEKIKQCPFCGSQNAKLDSRVSRYNEEYDAYFVECKSCGIRTSFYPDPNIALKVWNTREERRGA